MVLEYGIFLVIASTFQAQIQLSSGYPYFVQFLSDFIYYRPTQTIQFLITDDDNEWMLHVRKITKESQVNVNIQILNINNEEVSEYVLDTENLDRRLVVIPDEGSYLRWLSQVLSDADRIYPRILIFTFDGIDKIQEIFNFPHLNQIIIAEYGNNGYNLIECYRTDVTLPLITQRVGYWTTKNDASLNHGRLSMPNFEVATRRMNLQGRNVRCYSEDDFPQALYQPNSYPKFIGWMHELLSDISINLNFTYHCKPYSGNTFGIYLNGEWVGLLGELVHNATDMIVATSDRTAARSTAMDFSIAMEFTRFQAVLRRPENLHSWRNYTIELSMQCWLAFIGIMMALTYSVAKISQFNGFPDINISETLLIGAGALSTGYNQLLATHSLSLRIVLFVLHLFTFLIVSHYTCYLISTFTTIDTRVPFHTIRELLDDDSYLVGTRAGSSLEEFLNMTTEPIYKELRHKMESSNAIDKSNNLKFCKENLLASKKVHFGDKLTIQNAIKDDCRLYVMKEHIRGFGACFAIRKNYMPMKIFDSQLLRLMQNGVVKRYKSKNTVSSIDCTRKEGYKQVELKEVFSAFVFLLNFLFLSLIVLIAETVYKRLH